MYRILFIFALLLTLGLSVVSHQLFEPAIAHLSQTLLNIPAKLIVTHFDGCPFQSTKCAARLFDNLGNHHHPISTNIPLTQRYFDQGLTLAYGFNLPEAERSFREAARLDPNCAICYWGVALALGPNINATMDADAVPKAWAAIQKARKLSQNASDRERAYIQALAKRYSSKPLEDRSALDVAYVNAMRDVVQRYPDDLDAATLFAEAIMDTMPWSYWTQDGEPKPNTPELVATLESVLKRNPNHPSANHLYIHVIEPKNPELGIAAAERLAQLVPGSGHLLHMPSHIYIWVGRYHDAVVANQSGIASDQYYVTQCHAPDSYRFGYMAHNHFFLWYAAMMTGESKVAIQAAQHTAMMPKPRSLRGPGSDSMQHFYSLPFYALAKFGMWDKILAEPALDNDLVYPTGVWHYARGMAFTAKGQLENAAKELEKLQAIATDPAPGIATIWEVNLKILKTASAVLTGELAAKQGNYEQAIAQLKTAVELDDDLKGDPPYWYSPVRQSLGAVLLEAGRLADAEQVYREDLKKYPDNGWSLFGLAQSLRTQGKTEEAQAVQARFKEVWKYADVKLTASRF